MRPTRTSGDSSLQNYSRSGTLKNPDCRNQANEAELVLQCHDPSEHRLEELEQIIRQTAVECAATFNADAEVALLLNTRPAAMDPHLADLIRRGAEEVAAPHVTMPSGAGHDAMVLARHLPAAMLFVPSIGGRSHHVSEDTKEEDIVLGARVFFRAVELLLLEQKRAGGADSFTH